MLTPEEKKRLAEEAEKLALECAEGRAPPLARGELQTDDGHHCVMGEISFRACGDAHKYGWLNYESSDVREARWDLVLSNNNARPEDRHSAVVFPLLALRDALLEAP